MALEPEEKAAGRLFRSIEQAKLDEHLRTSSPDFEVLNVLSVLRHKCPARGVSTALELHEVYVASPEMIVETDDDGVHTAYVFESWVYNEVDTWRIAAGRFAFVYRRGRCPRCDARACSLNGRVVDGLTRPPLHGSRTR